MAADIVQNFHQELMAQERKRVALRIANGTKASSPQIISFRRQHPDYTGAGGDAQGSFNRPFFANKDESDKQLSGGVLRHFQYAQKILGQRAKDSLAQQAAMEGIPEAARPQGEPPVLDERESRELELNQLLSALQDEIESGNISQVAFSDVKAIPRLLIALVPAFTPEELARLYRFIDDMRNDILTEQLRAQGDDEGPGAAIAPEREPAGRSNIARLAAFLDNVNLYIRLAMEDSGLDPKTRVVKARATGKQVFDPKKVFVSQAKAARRGAPGRPGGQQVELVESVLPAGIRRAAENVILPLEPGQTQRNVPRQEPRVVERAPLPAERAITLINQKNMPDLLKYAARLIPSLTLKTEDGRIKKAQLKEALLAGVRNARVNDIRRAFNILD